MCLSFQSQRHVLEAVVLKQRCELLVVRRVKLFEQTSCVVAHASNACVLRHTDSRDVIHFPCRQHIFRQIRFILTQSLQWNLRRALMYFSYQARGIVWRQWGLWWCFVRNRQDEWSWSSHAEKLETNRWGRCYRGRGGSQAESYFEIKPNKIMSLYSFNVHLLLTCFERVLLLLFSK